jgi:mannose-6-phosphate isomerase-like protein (cupin superfamily)
VRERCFVQADRLIEVVVHLLVVRLPEQLVCPPSALVGVHGLFLTWGFALSKYPMARNSSALFRSRLGIAILVASGAGCVTAPAPVLISPAAGHREVGTLLAQNTLAAGQNIRAVEVERGPSSSLHLIQIRDREVPHVHTRYDLTIVLVRGRGALFLDGRAVDMRSGDTAYVARGTPHYFVNGGHEPAAALVSFAPAFSGPDQEPRPAP